MMLLRRLATVVAGVLPPRCVLCGVEAGASSLCAACDGLLEENRHACARCAQPLPESAPLCGHCIAELPPFEMALAGFVYRAPLDHLVQRLKFNRSLATARALGPRWASALRERRQAIDSPWPQALIPVPLHSTRLRQRGYNQALELARELASELALPVLPQALRRVRATPPQPGLDLDERRRNVRGAFTAHGPLPGRVALVDDVMTTGATLAEATRSLRRAGVEAVELWVLARRP